MAFNPLDHKGIPLEQQLRNWSELNVRPYAKHSVDPYTRCRVIALNGIEVESIFFSHQFNRHCADMNIKRKLAMTRRIEQQQQKAVNWLIPATEMTLERTLGYEQVAVDLTAYLARTEPDPYLKQAFEFGLLEDFDHLYRYANLMDLMYGKSANDIVHGLTEVIPGRPTEVEHRHPYDDVRKPMNAKAANPLSVLHVMTLVAAEQQTMNFYMNVGNVPKEPLARGLYLEIAQIEEQHVTHYESLLDPTESWFKQEVWHQYNECYMYHSFMSQESDMRLRQLWELHLNMELGHLQEAVRMYEENEKGSARDFLPKELPEPTLFESNQEYVRSVLEKQFFLTGNETEFVNVNELPREHRYFQYQKRVNGEFVPSRQVIDDILKLQGQDQRLELAS